ncbi:MAG: phosphate ABC transporter permease PstA [Acidimicrobiia bacterium]
MTLQKEMKAVRGVVKGTFPEGPAAVGLARRRARRGLAYRLLFLGALLLAVLALLTLVYTVINQAFGLVATENTIAPEEVIAEFNLPPDQDLASVDKDMLVVILQGHIAANAGRRLERDQRFYDDRLVFEPQQSWDVLCAGPDATPGCTLPARDQASVYQLVLERVIEPNAVATWNLVESIVSRPQIEALVAAEYPEATLDFRSWVSGNFVRSPQNPEPEVAGIRTAILGSLWLLAVTALFAFPVGVAAAIYLEEYAGVSRLNRLIQTNINNLAGVPSIIYGMLGLAIFVRALESFTSGSAVGATAAGDVANGRTVLSAGLTLGLLVLPVVIISAQEAIRAVPQSLRRAGLALGASKWQTIRAHVLPNAAPGILTGAILSMARAFGESAPLVVVGASTFITVDPSGPFSKFTALPIQIFQWTSRPQPEFQHIAAAAIVVLLVMLLALNGTAIILRNRFQRGY